VRVAIRTFFVFVLSIGESSSCLFSFSLAVVFFLALYLLIKLMLETFETCTVKCPCAQRRLGLFLF